MTELFANVTFWHWWILAAVLLALEMFAPTTLFLWTGVSAGVIGVALLVAPDTAWQVQVLAFAVLSVGSVVLYRRFVPRKAAAGPELNERMTRYVGQTYALESAIENGRGRVRVGDTTWIVQGPDLPAGARVTVVGTDGASLKVVAA
jgi:membrane protein implicated in regulation of membrane protease activity